MHISSEFLRSEMLYILFSLSQSFVVADKRDIQVSQRKYSIAVSDVFFWKILQCYQYYVHQYLKSGIQQHSTSLQ